MIVNIVLLAGGKGGVVRGRLGVWRVPSRCFSLALVDMHCDHDLHFSSRLVDSDLVRSQLWMPICA